MYKKLLILSLGAIAVSPAFASLTVTSVFTDLKGTSTSNANSNNYSSQLFTGSDSQSAISAAGTAYGSVNGTGSASQVGQSVSGLTHAFSESHVVGVGSGTGVATSYVKVLFTLDTASIVDYSVWASASGNGNTKNKGSMKFEYDGWAGGDALPVAGLGDTLTGTIALAAGNYMVELYNYSYTKAVSSSASSFAHSTATSDAGFEISAQAVPEPASMAVLAVGALALLRRRKQA